MHSVLIYWINNYSMKNRNVMVLDHWITWDRWSNICQVKNSVIFKNLHLRSGNLNTRYIIWFQIWWELGVNLQGVRVSLSIFFAKSIINKTIYLPHTGKWNYSSEDPVGPSGNNSGFILEGDTGCTPSSVGVQNVSPRAAVGLSGVGASGVNEQGERFSRKVFVGGLPPDIDEEEITASFRRFGPLVVDWPHKAESKSYFPPKGYAFLLFQVIFGFKKYYSNDKCNVVCPTFVIIPFYFLGGKLCPTIDRCLYSRRR